jgi:CRISPR-associated protein Csb2
MGLVMTVELLSGSYDAAEVDDRDRAEWPPHPARLFCALVAAARGEADRSALRWLEAQPSPLIVASGQPQESRRSAYVVANTLSVKGGNLAHPGRTNGLWSRTKAVPESPTVSMVWSVPVDADVVERLDQMARRVPYLGRSTGVALVAATAGEEATRDDGPGERQEQAADGRAVFEPCDLLDAEVSARVPYPGFLEDVDVQFEAGRPAWEVSRYRGYRRRRPPAATRVPASAGSAGTVAGGGTVAGVGAVAGVGTVTGVGAAAGGGTVTGVGTVTEVGTVAGAGAGAGRAGVEQVVPSVYTDVLVLQFSGLRPQARLTTRMTEALRSAVLKATGGDAPAVLHGHGADGRPHVAFLALPDVGHEHADGHLLGLAVAVPDLPEPERRAVLRAVLGLRREDVNDVVDLRVPGLGQVELIYRPGLVRPWGASPERWRRGSRCWVSATPVVLDRYPKRPDQVEREVRASLRGVGLPEPVDLRISAEPLLPGAARLRPNDLPAHARRRLFRHVAVTFDRRVLGPVLVGAGRYLGVGLLAPVAVVGDDA